GTSRSRKPRIRAPRFLRASPSTRHQQWPGYRRPSDIALRQSLFVNPDAAQHSGVVETTERPADPRQADRTPCNLHPTPDLVAALLPALDDVALPAAAHQLITGDAVLGADHGDDGARRGGRERPCRGFDDDRRFDARRGRRNDG